MKKIFALFAIITSLGLMACSIEEIEEEIGNDSVYISGDNTNIEYNDGNEEETLKNDFEILKYMTKKENYMVSPFSLKMAMMLAANGAEGNTRSQILRAFGVTNIDNYNEYAKELIEKYNSNENVKLNVANSIWLNSTLAGENVKFALEYENLVAKYFDGVARVENEDDIASKANRWIEEKTNNRIKNMLNEKSKADFLSLLINTIYFKGEWAEQFEKEATSKDVFTDRSSQETKIDFMNITSRYSYYEDANMRMVKIPYQGHETSMYIVLPINEDELDIQNALENMRMRKINLSIPKFKIEYRLSFADTLKQLGIKDAFDGQDARFKNVMFAADSQPNENIYIGDVLQKTFIEVDEAGTEAAAATAIIMKATSFLPEPEDIIDFKANRPFIYFVLDENNKDVLFIGEYAYSN